MKIVIELREDTYEAIRRIGSGSPAYIDRAILEGVILPKRHGRLIDADREEKGLSEMVVEDRSDITAVNFAKIIIHEAPTIVPADKEERE